MTFKISYVPETSLGTGQKEYILPHLQEECKQDAISGVTRHLPAGNFITSVASRMSSTRK